MATRQELLEQGWQEVTLQPGQDASDRIVYDPDHETIMVKAEAFNPLTGLAFEGKRPKVRVEDSAGGGRLVLDEPVGRPCVFLVKVRARSEGPGEPEEPEPEEPQEPEAAAEEQGEDEAQDKPEE